MGKITASIYASEINPLTGKIIGKGKSLKGRVQLINIYDNYSVVKIIEKQSPIKVGDVLIDIHAHIENGHKLQLHHSHDWHFKDASYSLQSPKPEPFAPLEPFEDRKP